MAGSLSYYIVGRTGGGSRIFTWDNVTTLPPEDVGINGTTVRDSWKLLIGTPMLGRAYFGRAYVWNNRRSTGRPSSTISVAQGGARIFRRRPL